MKTVLISGGSRGLGKAIATHLVPHFTVIIFAPNEAETRAAADEIGCAYKVGDVREYDQLQRIVDEMVAEYGTLDCVVNNAGIFLEGDLDSHEPELIQQALEINTLGTMFLSRAAISVMKQQKQGRIINIISQGGLYARDKYAVYAATKWAITGFTKSLQQSMAPYGIGVTGVYPGKLNTSIFETAGVERDLSDALEPDEVAKAVEFILSFGSDVTFPEIGVKHLAQGQ